MNCESINNLISAFIDDELGPIRTRQVKLHLSRCQRCRDDMAELQTLRLLLRSSSTGNPTPGFWSSVSTSIRAQNGSPYILRPRKSQLRFGFVTASVIIAVVAVTLMPRSTRDTTYPSRNLEPLTLVSLHADMRTDLPLADSGSARYIFTEARSNSGSGVSGLEIE
jgi:hypothetical protein